MASSIIQEIANLNTTYVKKQDADSVTFQASDMMLEVYDKDNLLGFKLTGKLDGTDVYIVHDTDNYARNNASYADMYKDARRDSMHIVKQFIGDRIRLKTKTKKGFFREKQITVVTIPDEKGRIKEYGPLTVNTVNFFE